MRRLLFLSILMTVGPGLPLWGQEIPSLMEMLALYPGRDAVYLGITDSTAINYENGAYVYSRQFRSQAMVLRKGGGGIAEAASPVITSDDKIELKAFTISPEGDTSAVLPEEVAKLELHARKVRYMISFPDARAGAVFTLEWRIDSGEPVFSGRRFLGRSYPVIYSRTTISSPVNWVFKFLVEPSCLYRQDRSREYIKGGELWVDQAWEARSLPGVKFEEDSPPESELIPCLYYAFSHDRRWSDAEKNKIDWLVIARSYGQHLFTTGRPGKAIQEEAKRLIEAVSDESDKVRYIVNFVTANFRALYSDIDISDSPDELLQRGYGSQAEAALLLGAFLRAAGIPHDYFLISTRDNGNVIRSLPALFYFNRLLVSAYAKADTIWIDPFYRGSPLGTLPFEDQAVEGLKAGIGSKDFFTTPISDYRENGHAIHLRVTFDDRGRLVAEGVELLSGSLNIEEKAVLQDLSDDQRYQRWLNLTTRGLPGAILDQLEFSDIYSDVDPFRISYRLTAANFIRSGDDRLYIPLDILGRWQVVKRYENRKHPLELGRPYSQQERLTIEIPAGFKVEYLPENFTLTSYLGDILSVVVVTANTITITRGLGIKPYRLKASAAESLNGFYSRAADQTGKYIVLRR